MGYNALQDVTKTTEPKERILVENDTVKDLKAFRIISSKIPISLFIVC